jgi:hypothetical protein
MTPSRAAPVLRVAAAWGTTIVGFKLLESGEDCELSDAPGALAAMPDGLAAAAAPLRAIRGGWELDARGAVSGTVLLRGREESIATLPVPISVIPGDYGLIQYGLFAVFFQYTTPAPAIARRTSPWLLPLSLFARLFHLDDLLSGLSLFSSVVFHLGIIGLLIVNWTPPDYRLPPELVSSEDYAERFGLKRVLPDLDPAAAARETGSGAPKGPKDPGLKDNKKQGGGQKVQGKEGSAGIGGKEERSELPGEIKAVTHYGGLSEALADTGTEIRKTLSEIQTVAGALGGLNSTSVLLGSGPGTGLRGTGSGGGGVGAGVLFGSGTLNTGWSAGAGGGFGTGVGQGGAGGGGNGARPGGGNGAGGEGGAGAGRTGERGVQAAGAVAAQGGLGPEQIRRVVIAHRGALQACYEIEAQRDPALRGGVTASWTIDPGGEVTSASVAGSTIHSPRVEGCVIRQVRTWHFPSSNGVSQATFPFSFGIGR